MPSANVIDQLLSTRRDLWRARSQGAGRQVLPTGFSLLDEALHDGGWPLGASTELLAEGLNWPLLLPALRQRLPGWVMLINPPWLPGAHWLAGQGLVPEQLLVLRDVSPRDALWAADQSLRAGCCALVCQWLPARGITDRDLRQLQLAAAKGGAWHLLVRPLAAAAQAAPAALRLQLAVDARGLQLQVLKQRGGWAGQSLLLPLWPELAGLQRQPVHTWPVHLTELPQLRRARPLSRSASVAALARA